MFTTANQPKSEVNWVFEWKSEEKVTVRSDSRSICRSDSVCFRYTGLGMDKMD